MESSLNSAPVYSSSVRWSEFNQIAVACGHLVTIFNPALLHGPRGYIISKENDFLRIGVPDCKENPPPSLLTYRFEKDSRSCVRSIDWSPAGFTSCGGCLLAVCTTDGRVRLHRSPFEECQPEWIEVIDLTHQMHEYHKLSSFEAALETVESASNPDFSHGSLPHSMGGDQAGKPEPSTCPSPPVSAPPGPAMAAAGQRKEAVGSSPKVWKSRANRAEARMQQGIIVDALFQKFESKRQLYAHLELPTYTQREHLRGLDKDILSESITETTSEFEAAIKEGNIDPKEIVRLARVKIRQRLINFSKSIPAASSTDPTPVPSTHILPKQVSKKSRLSLEAPEKAEEPEIASPGQPFPSSRRSAGSRDQLTELLSQETWLARRDLVTNISVAWSPAVCEGCSQKLVPREGSTPGGAFLAVGTRSGHVSIWHASQVQPRLERPSSEGGPEFSLLAVRKLHDSWVTALDCEATCRFGEGHSHVLMLLSGCSDGSLKLWKLTSHNQETTSPTAILTVIRNICSPGIFPVSCVALLASSLDPPVVFVAAGKSGGQLAVYSFRVDSPEPGSSDVAAEELGAHCQVVSGLQWKKEGSYLYSCSQDNQIFCWSFHGGCLVQENLPAAPPSEKPASSNDAMMPDMDSILGLALSPNDLMIATVRGVAQNIPDRMYVKRTIRGSLELHFVVEHVSFPRSNEQIDARWIDGGHALAPYSSALDDEASVPPVVQWNLWEDQLVHVLSSLATAAGSSSTIWDLKQSLRVATSPMNVIRLLCDTFAVPNVGPFSPSSSDLMTVTRVIDGFLSKSSTVALQTLVCLFRLFVLSVDAYSFLKPESKLMQPLSHFHYDDKFHLEALIVAIEHELRQRFLLATFNKLSSDAAPQSATSSLCYLLLPYWVLRNKSYLWMELATMADSTAAFTYGDKLCLESATQEMCSLCGASVALESEEWAECSGLSVDSPRHKLQRCMRTLRLCCDSLAWRCVVCKRTVSQESTNLLNLTGQSTRGDFLAGAITWQCSTFPRCYFCGVVLQATLPYICPTPSLV